MAAGLGTVAGGSSSSQLVALRVDPSTDRDKVSDKAGHRALHEGIVAQDDVLLAHVGFIVLDYGCGGKFGLGQINVTAHFFHRG